MARPDKIIPIRECFFMEQASKIKSAISKIVQKDSLSVEDTKAIRELADVYDSLVNPVPGKYARNQVGCNNGHGEESQ